MKSNKRTQVERSAATRDALIAAGRSLFATRGYGEIGTEAIARAAGVSRGALYHQFADKIDLFTAVFESVEAELIAGIEIALAESAETDPVALMRLGAGCWLDACSEPEMLRIALIEAPSVLGWVRWREIGDHYGVGLAARLITAAIALGRVAPQPVAPLAHVLVGALRESALYLAAASDKAGARAEVGAVIDRMIQALAVDG